MTEFDRRTLLTTTLAAPVAMLPQIARASCLTPQPVSFDLAAIPGLSARLGAVKPTAPGINGWYVGRQDAPPEPISLL